MQRAAVRAAVASARRAPGFLLKNRPPQNVGATRALATSTLAGGSGAGSNSYVRKFTLAIVSSLVLGSAYIASKGSNPFLAKVSLLSNPSDKDAFAAGAKEDVRIRKIVAVDHESLYTGTITGDGPLTKEDGRGGRKVLEMLTPDEASSKLRQNQESYLVGRDRGVYRYDVVQLPSNDPIEDDHAERIIEVPSVDGTVDDAKASTDWMFWGVFDGHSGWYTSAKLRQLLIGFVARELNATYKASSTSLEKKLPSPESIDAAIKKGFLRLDNEIIHESVEKATKAPSRAAAAEMLAPAFSGSCALLAFYDSQTNLLRVACTGDSRAVLGRLQDNGKWAATALSTDQTGSNKDEAKRIRSEHPGEEFAIANGRVLGGLEPTRAFGDSVYKWSLETQTMIKNKFFGRTPSQRLKTPPYVTAEPVVTTTQIRPEKGDFLVLATDGLWEMLSNEEVVGLVGKWLENQKKATGNTAGQSWFSSFFGWGGDDKKSLPIATNHDGNQDDAGQRVPIRQRQWGISGPEDRFVIKDQNCATHLVRNALGGKDSDMLCALLTLQSPYSRRYRDDLTVEVIFFGEGDKSGNVVVNEEATAKSKQQQQES